MPRRRPHLYILDGRTPVPCENTMEWARWCENDNRIDYTEITSNCRVSTIFTGLDARYFGDGPPLVFETMIFGGPDSLDLSQWRYSSWDDAEIGHKAAVRKARTALGQKVA